MGLIEWTIGTILRIEVYCEECKHLVETKPYGFKECGNERNIVKTHMNRSERKYKDCLGVCNMDNRCLKFKAKRID